MQMKTVLLLFLVLVPYSGLSAQAGAREIADPDLQRQMERQRFRVLSYDELTPRQQKDWDDYEAIRPGRNPGNIAWSAFLRVPDLVDTMVRLRVHYGSEELQVSPKIYEWAAIITAREWTANHPWNSHNGAAIREGVKAETVRSLAEGRRPINMTEDEALAYDFLQELWKNRHITDSTYERAVAMFGEAGIIELVSIQALYGAIGASHAVIDAQERANELAPFTNRFNPPASMPR
jgi:4-carboxymuconolactone decarboxylase